MKFKTRVVVTIHDLIHWIFRDHFFTPIQAFYAKTMFERAVSIADHMITVSEKTREDLILHFNADPEKISVIYEGVGKMFRELNDPRLVQNVCVKYQIPENYFLFVGSLKPHKNVLWLVRLFRRLKKEGKVNAGLVLVGKKDKRYPAGHEELALLKNEGGIYHLPFIEDEELIALYNGALALIHPSLYEGFGLTLLEAMSCGAPVIACASASVPEVTGDAACLVESCADREMAEAIVRMEKSENLREDFRRKGRMRVRQFSWDDAAQKTAEIYERVLSEK